MQPIGEAERPAVFGPRSVEPRSERDGSRRIANYLGPLH